MGQTQISNYLQQKYTIQHQINQYEQIILKQKNTSQLFILIRNTLLSQSLPLKIQQAQLKQTIGSDHYLKLRQFRSQQGICPQEKVLFKLFQFYYHHLGQQIQARAQQDLIFEQSELWSILLSTTLALVQLQKKQLFHGCIIPEQIYITQQGIIKLGDRQLCPYFQKKSYIKGLYYSPEELRNMKYPGSVNLDMHKSDIFSLGMCIIHAGLLQRCQQMYCQQGIDFRAVERKLNKLQQRYSNNLRKSVELMVNEDKSCRLNGVQLQLYFKKLMSQQDKNPNNALSPINYFTIHQDNSLKYISKENTAKSDIQSNRYTQQLPNLNYNPNFRLNRPEYQNYLQKKNLKKKQTGLVLNQFQTNLYPCPQQKGISQSRPQFRNFSKGIHRPNILLNNQIVHNKPFQGVYNDGQSMQQSMPLGNITQSSYPQYRLQQPHMFYSVDYRTKQPINADQYKLQNYKTQYKPAQSQYKPAQSQYRPAQYKPAQYKPTQYKPSQYIQKQYKPVQYKQTQYIQTQYKPTQYKPTQYKPAQYKPTQYKQTQYISTQYKPTQYKTTQYYISTAQYIPALYKPIQNKAQKVQNMNIPRLYNPSQQQNLFQFKTSSSSQFINITDNQPQQSINQQSKSTFQQYPYKPIYINKMPQQKQPQNPSQQTSLNEYRIRKPNQMITNDLRQNRIGPLVPLVYKQRNNQYAMVINPGNDLKGQPQRTYQYGSSQFNQNYASLADQGNFAKKGIYNQDHVQIQTNHQAPKVFSKAYQPQPQSPLNQIQQHKMTKSLSSFVRKPQIQSQIRQNNEDIKKDINYYISHFEDLFNKPEDKLKARRMKSNYQSNGYQMGGVADKVQTINYSSFSQPNFKINNLPFQLNYERIQNKKSSIPNLMKSDNLDYPVMQQGIICPKSTNLSTPDQNLQQQQFKMIQNDTNITKLQQEQSKKQIPTYITEEYKSGAVYEGWKLNGLRQGHGKFYYPDGGIYSGMWKANKMHGHGILYYSGNKPAYDGNWENDKFHGLGALFNQNPEQLLEGFNYRDFDQIGNYWMRYQGQFKQDNKQGLGRLYLTNDEIFQGTFLQDQINGNGIFFGIDDKVQGYWQNNKLIQ